MVHLSEVLGLPVIDARGERLGRVDDLQVDSQRFAIEHLVLKRRRQISTVPWRAIETFSPEARQIVLAEGQQPVEGPMPAGEALCLKRDVLDRQIIDVQGRNVVRVNDISLEALGGELVLRRVEVGLSAAVRRLLAGIVSTRVVRQIAAGLREQGISWDYVALVEPRTAKIRLKVHQHLARMHPADLADILEDLGRVERRAVMSGMDPETAARALSEAEPNVQAAVVEEASLEQAADLLEEMPPDDAADILGELPEERSEALLDAMESEASGSVRELLRFSEDSAGGLMNTEFFTVRASSTVGEARAALQNLEEDQYADLDEIPLLAAEEKLIGVVPLARLVRAADAAPVTEVMRRETRAVTTSTPLREVVERFEKYNLRALAVVDDFGRLVGMINIQDIFTRIAER